MSTSFDWGIALLSGRPVVGQLLAWAQSDEGFSVVTGGCCVTGGLVVVTDGVMVGTEGAGGGGSLLDAQPVSPSTLSTSAAMKSFRCMTVPSACIGSLYYTIIFLNRLKHKKRRYLCVVSA